VTSFGGKIRRRRAGSGSQAGKKIAEELERENESGRKEIVGRRFAEGRGHFFFF